MENKVTEPFDIVPIKPHHIQSLINSVTWKATEQTHIAFSRGGAGKGFLVSRTFVEGVIKTMVNLPFASTKYQSTKHFYLISVCAMALHFQQRWWKQQSGRERKIKKLKITLLNSSECRNKQELRFHLLHNEMRNQKCYRDLILNKIQCGRQ